jgi:hypothetical protein
MLAVNCASSDNNGMRDKQCACMGMHKQSLCILTQDRGVSHAYAFLVFEILLFDERGDRK